MAASTVSQSAIEAALGDLRSFLSDRATAAVAAREHHSHGESSHTPGLPDLVCYPQSTEEVSRIVKVSARYGLPIVPFGAGTSLEGGVNATRGGRTATKFPAWARAGNLFYWLIASRSRSAEHVRTGRLPLAEQT